MPTFSDPSRHPQAPDQHVRVANRPHVPINCGTRDPATWFTRSRDDTETCRFFHPTDFEIPADYEVAEVSIVIEAFEVDFDGWVASFDEPELIVHERSDVTVAGGARGVRLVSSFAEEPDIVWTTYFIDRGADVLALTSSSAHAPDPEAAAGVLDEMVQSLEFFT